MQPLVPAWNPDGNYLFIVNNRNTRTRCEICSKLTIKNQNDAGEAVDKLE